MVRAVVSLALTAVGCLLAGAVEGAETRPNVVLFITDDQDQVLGGSFPTVGRNATPLAQTRRLLVDEGATALNFYVHTPICCPSRSELLTGRYFHNLRQRPGVPHCMHIDQAKVDDVTFLRRLKEGAGYATAVFGKYLNNMPAATPRGIDAWMANEGGNYVGPEFAVAGLEAAMGWPAGTRTFPAENYTTSVVGNVTLAWLDSLRATGSSAAAAAPFFAYVAPKAAHEPFNPAPWYADVWDAAWPAHEPRPEIWNASYQVRQKHHGQIALAPMLSAQAARVITDVFKMRWRCLLSVDDLIAAVVEKVQDQGLLESTYFFYTSDHGFQLGEFNILMDKRHPYDWDTKVHLVVRGPGIRPGSRWGEVATMVDLAPTFLGLAGLAKPPDLMDGRSLAHIFIDEAQPALPPSVLRHLKGEEGRRRDETTTSSSSSNRTTATTTMKKKPWRDSILIEYYYNSPNGKCVENCTLRGRGYPFADSWCGDLRAGQNADCWLPCEADCYDTETHANNYIALRSLAASPFGEALYVEFETGDASLKEINFDPPTFHEYFDVRADPWCAKNLYEAAPADDLRRLHTELRRHFNCAGDECP